MYISVCLGEVDPAIGEPAERRYKERRVALERQLEVVYRKIGQTDKQINRLKQRPKYDCLPSKPALTELTKQNSEPDMLQYILALRHSIYQKIIIMDDDGFPREVRLEQYDEEINNLEIPTSVALDHIWNRTLKQEDYNNMVNGMFRFRNEKEKISTECLGEYLDKFPKASDFGLTEVTGDQTDLNVSNLAEERPTILFPNAEEYKVEMALLRKGIEERYGGR